MRKFSVGAMGTLAAAITLMAAPAQAELVNARDPAAIKAIVESQGFPADLVTKEGDNPYIESTRAGMKFLILFMNCDDSKANCKTLQFYMGFSDAKDTTLERINEWNSERRFARAYVDSLGDPVMEMDLDLDFGGLPRENVGEAFNTWTSLMDSYHQHIFNK